MFTFDPWMWACHEEINEGKFILNLPQAHVITEGFSPVIERVFKFDSLYAIDAILKNSLGNPIEYMILKDCNHYHQTDAICIAPVEAFIKSSNKP